MQNIPYVAYPVVPVHAYAPHPRRRRPARPFPAVNITETPDSYTLELVAPGRKREDFQVNVVNQKLVISSQVNAPAPSQHYRLLEFQLAPFKRAFPLSDRVDTTAITARYADGLLIVHVPKKAEEPETPTLSIDVA